MEQDAHRVIVRTPELRRPEGWGFFFGHKGPRVDYRVRVPLRTATRVLSRSGAVQISHIEAVVHTEARSGRLGVDDVRGDVTIVSRSGSVLVERVAGDVVAEARSGKIRLADVQGRASLEASSGSIELDGIGGDVRIIARSGGITIDDVGGKVYARTHAGGVRLRGAIRDDVDIEAHAGAITLAVDPSLPFFIDAESHAGSVRSDLPPRRNGSGPASGGPKVRLRTHAGAIRVTRA
jgi:DUF4097 and DUF4098 domain-containing protein YvlB